MIMGDVASFGVARGKAFVCACSERTMAPRRTVRDDETQHELGKFDAAVSEAEKDLLILKERTQQSAGEEEASIFEAHIQLLHDPMLREEISALCLIEKLNVEAALDEAIDKLAALFVQLEDPSFQERGADLRDVGNRLRDILAKRQVSRPPVFPDGSVVVTGELLPSIIAQLNSRTIRALVIEHGGQTAHATILARAAGIPMLIQVPEATTRIHSGDRLIVDGLAGRVFINPSPAILHEYDQLEADFHAHQTALKSLIDLPAVTQDGIPIKLCANIGKSADAVVASSLNADGIGLYRTEFVFLVQDHFPSEEEQYKIYRGVADRMPGRDVVIRILDIGSDKLLPYFPLPRETNPSLGIRGIRLLLAHPEILHAQLRAILRLSATHPVSILFPMIGGMEDLLSAKTAIENAKASLTAERLAFNPAIAIGAMIETPAAAILTGQLAPEVDFFSIGTNDLVQYLLTTDRMSSAVAAYYEPLHPAVLQVLSSVAAEAKVKTKRISICGEMAGNPAYTQLLLGLGFRSFSVNPGELLGIKNAIRSTNINQAERLAGQVLQLGVVQKIKNHLRTVS